MLDKQQRPVILCVVGARPNFIKIAPIMEALRHDGRLSPFLVHTGQHYDPEMNDHFFSELGIPQPDAHLAVGSGTHAVQTAEVMMRLEPVIDSIKPRLTLVVGDVNSTLAASLVSAKKLVPVAHVEAGLRSFDRTMPEEVNRILTDHLSNYLFASERDALQNLAREGVEKSYVHFVGNVMIDAVHRFLPRSISPQVTLGSFGHRAPPSFAVLTLHRPSNVDDLQVLGELIDTVVEIGERLPVVFPVHPRTRARMENAGFAARLRAPYILTTPPIGYLAMLGLLSKASLVLTDSGGLQEETTALGVPCLTLRPNTERPITVSEGTSTIVGNDPARIRAAFHAFLAGESKRGRAPELWDGRTASRIATILGDDLAGPA